MSKFFGDGHETYRAMLSGRRLLADGQRLKSLRDVCLEFVGNHLDRLTRASQYLATVHKELILERLAFHDRLTDAYLPHVTYNLFSPGLQRLHLYGCRQVTDAWLRLLADSRCSLRFLTIRKCENVSDAGIQAITTGQDCLMELELRKLKISRKGLINVRSPCLEKVDFRGCNLLDDKAIQTLVCANPSIRYLNLATCVRITDAVFPVIAQNLKTNLEFLDVTDIHCLSDGSIIALANNCPNLKSLNILGCGRVSTEAMVQMFQSCGTLQCLDLSYCMRLVHSPSSASLLFDQLPASLQELSLNGLQINDAQLLVAGLEHLVKLSKLRLCGVPAVDDECLKQIMQRIGAQLTFLDISGSVMCNITDDGLSYVTTCCKNLETLGISLLKEVTGITLVPMFENHQVASRIECLLLSLRKLDVLTLQAVAENCSNLKQLDLSGAPVVTDAAVKQLANTCTQLSSICLKACRNVTDEGVLALAVNCPLCYVVLSGLHSITDKSILALANSCPYLEELYISGCENVSQAAVHYLQDMCIPRVYVTHRVPKSCSTARNLDTGNYEVQS